jgi:hypothetical protein
MTTARNDNSSQVDSNGKPFSTGMYHLRFADEGTPGGIVLRYHNRYRTFMHLDKDEVWGGWNDGALWGWDVIDNKWRQSTARRHYQNAGITGAPHIRQRDQAFSEWAAACEGLPYGYATPAATTSPVRREFIQPRRAGASYTTTNLKATFVPLHQSSQQGERVFSMDVMVVEVRRGGEWVDIRKLAANNNRAESANKRTNGAEKGKAA